MSGRSGRSHATGQKLLARLQRILCSGRRRIESSGGFWSRATAALSAKGTNNRLARVSACSSRFPNVGASRQHWVMSAVGPFRPMPRCRQMSASWVLRKSWNATVTSWHGMPRQRVLFFTVSATNKRKEPPHQGGVGLSQGPSKNSARGLVALADSVASGHDNRVTLSATLP